VNFYEAAALKNVGVERQSVMGRGCMKRDAKTKLVTVLAAIIGVGIYFAMHFTTIEHKGQKIRIYKKTEFSQLFSSFQTGVVLGTHDLQTEYGNIRMYPYCKIDAEYGKLFKIDTDKNVVHDLVFWGAKPPERGTIKFDIHTGKTIGFRSFATTPIDIKGVVLDVEGFFMENNPDKPGLIFYIYKIPPEQEICLSDGTRILFRSYAFLSMYDTGVWEMNRERGASSGFLVIRAGEEEGKEYRSFRFYENWGSFIDGVEFTKWTLPKLVRQGGINAYY
jgi:hypothetical protein